MGDSSTGQVSDDAAIIYETVYLPALFLEWCPRIIAAASVGDGDDVIDVACGTGALAIETAMRVGTEGSVVGLDINAGMLKIASAKSTRVAWHRAAAEAMPFEDARFDRVVSQFGLMYFEDQQAAAREMIRVLRPGGSLAIAVWDRLENNPGLAAEEFLWQRVFDEAVDEAPYRLGDIRELGKLFEQAGIDDFRIETHAGRARFDSIEQWIHTGAKGWTEDDRLTDEELGLLLATAEKELIEFKTSAGSVCFPTSAHILTLQKKRAGGQAVAAQHHGVKT